jgi:hypothetical protein
MLLKAVNTDNIALLRYQNGWSTKLTEFVNIANARTLAILDWPGNDGTSILGIWTYCSGIDGSNHRLAEDDCSYYYSNSSRTVVFTLHLESCDFPIYHSNFSPIGVFGFIYLRFLFCVHTENKRLLSHHIYWVQGCICIRNQSHRQQIIGLCLDNRCVLQERNSRDE